MWWSCACAFDHFMNSFPCFVPSFSYLMIRRTWQNTSIYNVRTLFYERGFRSMHFDPFIIHSSCNVIIFEDTMFLFVHCLTRLQQQPKFYTIRNEQQRKSKKKNGIVHNKPINWINRTYAVVYFLVSASFDIDKRRLFCGWLYQFRML